MKNILKKIGQILFCFVPIVITLGIQFAVMLPIAFYYFVVQGYLGNITQVVDDAGSWVYDLLLYSDFTVYVTVGWGLVSLTVFYLWYKRKHDATEDIPIKKTLSLYSIGGMLLMILGLQIAIQYIYSIVEMYYPKLFDVYNELMDTSGYGTVGALVMFVYGVFVAPIHEEFLNRGVTLHYAQKAMPFWVANVFQAAVFGLLHMNLVQGSYAFVAGVVLGYVYRESRNIWTPIFFHMTFNLFGMLVPLMPLTGTGVSAYVLAGFIGAIITLSGLVLFRMAIRQRDEEL